MNFSAIFGGKTFTDENPMPGKLRMSTMMNNFFQHEANEPEAERLMEGNEPAFDESFLDNLGSVRAEEHLARREAQDMMLNDMENPTDRAKEKLKALIAGWSYQPPQSADEHEEAEALGIIPETEAPDEELEKIIGSRDPVKILSMVLRKLAED